VSTRGKVGAQASVRDGPSRAGPKDIGEWPETDSEGVEHRSLQLVVNEVEANSLHRRAVEDPDAEAPEINEAIEAQITIHDPAGAAA
jgi:hypothetical protein